MTGPRLFSPPRGRRGRNERAADTVAAALRRLDAYDEIAQARITLSRTLARALDELEADPEGTKYTIGSVGRVLRDVYADLAVPFGTDRSLDELLAALRADDDDLPTDTRNPPQP